MTQSQCVIKSLEAVRVTFGQQFFVFKMPSSSFLTILSPIHEETDSRNVGARPTIVGLSGIPIGARRPASG